MFKEAPTPDDVPRVAALMEQTTALPCNEEELVRSHLPLVSHIVRETAAGLPSHVDRDDLTSAAMSALVRAARSFREEQGVPFSAWAALKIRGALLDEMRSHDWASRSVRLRARERDTATDRLTAQLGRMPTRAELASELAVDVAELQQHENDVHRAVVLSLSAPSPSGSDIGDLLPADRRTPEQIFLQRERAEAINAAIACLPDRLRDVIVGYYLENRPMGELASELGVTESRVSQLRAEAVVLLQTGLTEHLDGLVATEPKPGGRRRHTAYLASLAARSAEAAVVIPRPRTQWAAVEQSA